MIGEIKKRSDGDSDASGFLTSDILHFLNFMCLQVMCT